MVYIMKRFFTLTLDYFKRMDKLLLILCIIITVFGIFLLYTLNLNDISSYVSSRQWKTQAVAMIIGVIAALVLSGIDYSFISKIWWTYTPVAVILSLLVFTSLGRGVDGADDIGWLNLGFIQFQPSEMLKIAFILTFATHLHKCGSKVNDPLNMLFLCIHGAVPTLIIMKQGDDGSALVFIFIFAAMLFSAGLSWKYMLAALVAVPPLIYVVWNYFMQPHQLKRFQVLFDEEMQQAEILGIYNQQWLGKKALGSGQLTGLGIFGSDKYTYVPEIDTDFIFSYIGMTLGFVGCLVTIILLASLCLKTLSVGSGSKDNLGRYICTGVFAMIFSHSVINIGMALAVLPVIGIPLPFLSAGGTSVISLYVAVGLVMSVHSHRRKAEHMFYSEKYDE